MNNYRNYIIIGLLAVIALLALLYLPKKDASQTNNNNDQDGQTVTVTDFMSCAEAGYPVAESFPAQCRTPDGQVYVEDINESPEVVITSPTRGQLVTSPMTVSGKAKGNWFFEANLPITLKDETGKVLVQKGAQAEGDWMTPDYVNFSMVLEFAPPTTQYGVLLIEKDNPSGLPQNDSSFAIPVKFR